MTRIHDPVRPLPTAILWQGHGWRFKESQGRLIRIKVMLPVSLP
jgi:hypothetical protein